MQLIRGHAILSFNIPAELLSQCYCARIRTTDRVDAELSRRPIAELPFRRRRNEKRRTDRYSQT